MLLVVASLVDLETFDDRSNGKPLPKHPFK